VRHAINQAKKKKEPFQPTFCNLQINSPLPLIVEYPFYQQKNEISRTFTPNKNQRKQN
jgi:hypothetical protein